MCKSFWKLSGPLSVLWPRSCPSKFWIWSLWNVNIKENSMAFLPFCGRGWCNFGGLLIPVSNAPVLISEGYFPLDKTNWSSQMGIQLQHGPRVSCLWWVVSLSLRRKFIIQLIQNRVPDTWSGVTSGCDVLCGCWNPNPDPLPEQCAPLKA